MSAELTPAEIARRGLDFGALGWRAVTTTDGVRRDESGVEVRIRIQVVRDPLGQERSLWLPAERASGNAFRRLTAQLAAELDLYGPDPDRPLGPAVEGRRRAARLGG